MLGKCQLAAHVKILLTAAVESDTLPRLAGRARHWPARREDLFCRPISGRRIAQTEKQASDWSSALSIGARSCGCDFSILLRKFASQSLIICGKFHSWLAGSALGNHLYIIAASIQRQQFRLCSSLKSRNRSSVAGVGVGGAQPGRELFVINALDQTSEADAAADAGRSILL